MKASRFTVLLALLVLAGCSPYAEEPGDPQSPLAPVFTTLQAPPLDSLEWESFKGVISPGAGGIMLQASTTWPRNCSFGINVPPDALDPAWDPIEITIQVPTRAMYQQYPELAGALPMRFFPSGLHFLAPVTITATWMPWEQFLPGYYESDYLDGNDSSSVEVIYLSHLDRYRMTYAISHFSDWEVTRRGGGGSGQGPYDPHQD